MRQSVYYSIAPDADIEPFDWIVSIWFCFDGHWTFYRGDFLGRGLAVRAREN